jgi:hypothetical protein
MPRHLDKWRAARAARAITTLREIETSIEALHAECLLDLHDIFREHPGSALGEMAEAEMTQRGLRAPE